MTNEKQLSNEEITKVLRLMHERVDILQEQVLIHNDFLQDLLNLNISKIEIS